MFQPPRLSPRNTRLFRVVVSLIALGSLSALLAYGPSRALRLVSATLGQQERESVSPPNSTTASQDKDGGIHPNSLGNYPDTKVQLGANTTITPSAAPASTTSINVATSPGFNGKLEADPTTGVVRVTDAHPAGIYTVTVT